MRDRFFSALVAQIRAFKSSRSPEHAADAAECHDPEFVAHEVVQFLAREIVALQLVGVGAERQ